MIGESLMKNTLRLMTIFMGIIGGCAAILVVFIVNDKNNCRLL